MARSTAAPVRRKTAVTAAAGSTAEEIAKVAYELFVQRGGTHGSDQEDWFEAERIVAQRRQAAQGRRSW